MDFPKVQTIKTGLLKFHHALNLLLQKTPLYIYIYIRIGDLFDLFGTPCNLSNEDSIDMLCTNYQQQIKQYLNSVHRQEFRH